MDLQQAIDQAQAAYKELDQAQAAQDWRKVGAAMYKLKQALDAIQAAAKSKPKR